MISEKMETALNEQINWELLSSYLYLAMSAYFESIDLVGAANWMRVQAQEELFHAIKIYDYINERDGRPHLLAVEEPQKEWKSPLDAFEAAYEHEKVISSRFNDLMALAQAENDQAAKVFLQWFINEQVEEEAAALAIIKKLRLVGDSKSGLFMVDTELGQRVYTPPATPAQ
jgi:ferritin